MKSWDGVDPDIIERARVRGDAVDRYMAEYARTKNVVVENEPAHITDRVVIAHRIYEEQFGGKPVEAQMAVYDLDDGVAGTLDFWVDNQIVADLKCTYAVERSWILQLGAYVAMTGAKRCGVIHVSPKVYPDGGRWLEYNPTLCAIYWQKSLDWWRETKRMESSEISIGSH